MAVFFRYSNVGLCRAMLSLLRKARTLAPLVDIQPQLFHTLVVGWVSLQKWTMCSRTGYKCQIWYTDTLGYGEYHVIRPPRFFPPECFFLSFSNVAAIKNQCSSQICPILNINDFLSNLAKLVYHIHSRVNIKCTFQISRSMSRSMLHFEPGHLIITILFCHYLNFGLKEIRSNKIITRDSIKRRYTH